MVSQVHVRFLGLLHSWINRAHGSESSFPRHVPKTGSNSHVQAPSACVHGRTASLDVLTCRWRHDSNLESHIGLSDSVIVSSSSDLKIWSTKNVVTSIPNNCVR